MDHDSTANAQRKLVRGQKHVLQQHARTYAMMVRAAERGPFQLWPAVCAARAPAVPRATSTGPPRSCTWAPTSTAAFERGPDRVGPDARRLVPRRWSCGQGNPRLFEPAARRARDHDSTANARRAANAAGDLVFYFTWIKDPGGPCTSRRCGARRATSSRRIRSRLPLQAGVQCGDLLDRIPVVEEMCQPKAGGPIGHTQGRDVHAGRRRWFSR